ncbi:hypothetical protein PHYPSEUDO_002279 [Phytophthora pseudosyringae]|uniref:Uncharacterized protein n=1 Tax=Phytophthora pseudosyringae TaxID=221518 RepID=A0A8T1VXY0_9STRA|nr:hypothetical protein PHYPSEUDO_002279 [Phytophthora pseudosyringae]
MSMAKGSHHSKAAIAIITLLHLRDGGPDPAATNITLIVRCRQPTMPSASRHEPVPAASCRPPTTHFTPPPEASQCWPRAASTDGALHPTLQAIDDTPAPAQATCAGRAQRATDDAPYTPLQATPAPPASATCCSHALQRR